MANTVVGVANGAVIVVAATDVAVDAVVAGVCL